MPASAWSLDISNSCGSSRVTVLNDDFVPHPSTTVCQENPCQDAGFLRFSGEVPSVMLFGGGIWSKNFWSKQIRKMPENGIRSTYSQSPFQIHMCDDEGVISTGSAFLYDFEGDTFIITNWHNFSGRHFLTREPLCKSRRTFPLFINAKLASFIFKGETLANGSFTTAATRVEIFCDREPLWYEHPILGSKCDLVALPFQRPDTCPEFMNTPVNKISRDRIPIEPGGVVFIIGFPKSISVGIGLPIWKSGYIASEPHFGVTIDGEICSYGGLAGGTNLPAFFIDSLTREGMSGSPVFAKYTGAWDQSDPYAGLDFDSPEFWKRNDVVLGGSGMEFIGCYSGRIGAREEGAALGLCWPVSVINEICSSKSRASNPH